ncbi:DUF2461 domain-containing protein [Hymenobacter sp. BT664]|uniref:DUF2461 domain-containing protein n=1 Tax=Hymenobacter montanus TaxID=2771359 RepID=A0A927GJL1_9BACT|nr:DUF2461 domain-containing protein [Hymenobacter montanus]MBD2768264.1 DUF2461 domain-containing protein [Hymenobacter montanus]
MQLTPLFTFLAGLAKHNERPWFQERKATYDQLRAQFEEDAAFWARELAQLDPALAGPAGRKTVFRIYRDVRFSKNKDPYKTHFSVYFTAGAGKEIDSPGYYLQLGPNGNTLIAGGLYQPDKTQLAAIRQEIDYNADELKALLATPDFQRYFGALTGEKLKKAPAGYAVDHPEIELLKHKSFLASHQMADAEVLSHEDFRTHALEVFRAMVPLCQFLRNAVA